VQTPPLHMLARYRRRLSGLSLPGKAYFVANTLCGEVFRRRTIGTLGLRLAEIDVTNACQCRCVHCYAADDEPQDTRDELTTVEIERIVDELAALHVTEVCFTGGEPLLRGELARLIAHARRHGMLPKINTNGILLSPERISALKRAGLAWCAVSIDSSHPAKHDALRKFPGCYELAVGGLRELVRQGVPAAITTYARKEAVHDGDLARVVFLGHELGLDAVRILFPVPLGRLRYDASALLTREERDQVRELVKDPIVTMESPREGTTCLAAVSKFSIHANGDVTPCVFVDLPLGNVRRQSVAEVWAAMADFGRQYKPAGQCPMGDPDFREMLLARLAEGAKDEPAPAGSRPHRAA
jgi:AdoMet-dependent heme synthase